MLRNTNTMSSRYYRKEIPTQPLYLPTGSKISFDAISDGYGYYATANGYEIAQLMICIREKKGGVVEISEAEYQDYLKKKSETPQFQLRGQRPSIGPVSHVNPFARNRDAVVPASANMVGVMADGRAIQSFAQPQKSEGLSVPKSFAKPKVAKIGV